MEDTLLQIKISNHEPLTLLDLTQAMTAVNSQYHRFLGQLPNKPKRVNSQLYVKRVVEGSVLFDLIERAQEVLPGITPHIIEYGRFLIDSLNFLSGKEKAAPKGYVFGRDDYLNFKKIVEPVAVDRYNSLTINGTLNGNVIINNNVYNYGDASIIQNKAEREIKELQKAGDNLLRLNTKLALYQARDSNLSRSTRGNLGIVRDVSPEPKVLSFANDRLRYDIVNSDDNPFGFVYLVDLEVQLREGSSALLSDKDIKGYEILKLHGVVPTESQPDLLQ